MNWVELAQPEFNKMKKSEAEAIPLHSQKKKLRKQQKTVIFQESPYLGLSRKMSISLLPFQWITHSQLHLTLCSNS